MKTIELAVTDERGEQHVLRSTLGIKVDLNSNGSLVATAEILGGKARMLAFAPGRWLCYRTDVQI